MESLIVLLTAVFISVAGHIECPGLPTRKGISLECISTRLGAVKFNCSNPMPVDTVAHYSCQPYYKETSALPTLFEGKSIRCNRNGVWARYQSFRTFNCQYECGKALPSTKRSVIKGQLKSRTTWPWHALIFLKLNWAKVSEAIQYRRTVAAANRRANEFDSTDIGEEEDTEGEPYSDDDTYAYSLDPVKLAEIFDNDDLSREEIFDPRYRYIYICGGTLISETEVLTAAHCLTDLRGQVRATKDFMVVLGGTTNNFYDNMDEPNSQFLPVSRLHISEDFNYDEYRSDIAVVQLLHPVTINGAVLPACLPENRDDSQLFIANKKHGETIGSMINVYKEGVSEELKSKKLQVLPNIDCVRNIQRIPSDKEFCAGSLGAHICSGDSGGGLIATPNFGLRRRHTIQGIVSYARARRVCENYAVFTRVYKYLPFIKSIMYANETIPAFLPMPL